MIDPRRDLEFKDTVLINFINLTDREKEMVRVWRNNENIRKWMYSNHIISEEEHSGFIERLRNGGNNFYWISKDSMDRYMGAIYLNRVDLVDRDAYLGIYKSPDCGLSGAGLLLMRCLKRLAFDIADLQTLRLEVMDGNTRAIRFYEEVGFQEEGKREGITIMSIRKEEEVKS